MRAVRGDVAVSLALPHAEGPPWLHMITQADKARSIYISRRWALLLFRYLLSSIYLLSYHQYQHVFSLQPTNTHGASDRPNHRHYSERIRLWLVIALQHIALDMSHNHVLMKNNLRLQCLSFLRCRSRSHAGPRPTCREAVVHRPEARR